MSNAAGLFRANHTISNRSGTTLSAGDSAPGEYMFRDSERFITLRWFGTDSPGQRGQHSTATGVIDTSISWLTRTDGSG